MADQGLWSLEEHSCMVLGLLCSNNPDIAPANSFDRQPPTAPITGQKTRGICGATVCCRVTACDPSTQCCNASLSVSSSLSLCFFFFFFQIHKWIITTKKKNAQGLQWGMQAWPEGGSWLVTFSLKQNYIICFCKSLPSLLTLPQSLIIQIKHVDGERSFPTPRRNNTKACFPPNYLNTVSPPEVQSTLAT